MQPVLLPDSLKNTLNLASNGGVIVVNVEPNGPADQAGVFIGDVLLSLNDKPVTDTGDVQTMLGPECVGKTVSVQIIRGGALTKVQVLVGERPQRGE